MKSITYNIGEIVIRVVGFEMSIHVLVIVLPRFISFTEEMNSQLLRGIESTGKGGGVYGYVNMIIYISIFCAERLMITSYSYFLHFLLRVHD